MRNLKKILALVLALVMAMSVMTVASAKFEDSDKVNAKFATAVEVLNGLKVFQGYEDGTFNPKGKITRAEVAAIIYRIDTGDVQGKQAKIYSDYNKFDDVKSTAWYAGYVNYCANAQYIRGYDEKTFGPNDYITGYQALAMILRVIGYDKNGEFSGSAWQIETAKYAQRLGLTKNVDADLLGVEKASRELVAELLFRAITEPAAYQVDYNLLYNYYQVGGTIGEDRFDLTNYRTTDEWGRPATAWDATLYNKYGTIVYIPDAPLAVYTEAVDQCTVRKDTGVYGNITKFYVNGVLGQTYINGQHHVENDFLAESEQGTVVEVYADKTIVVIDTYLSYVSKVVTNAFDKNGHQYRWASDTFTLFNAPVETSSLDGNNFTKGDFWLVNYNEKYGYVEPYATPATLDAKQTYIWWNAAKHTIDGTVYMDNANYGADLDDAGYDKDDAYTWFFDTYGNVIGSMEIYVAAPEAQYAVVLGAQWVNQIGKPGYAAATIQYMNGEIVEGAVISKVETNPAQYGGTIPTTTGKTFADGYFYTTYQYNLGTTDHLYMVKSTDAGLELTAVATIGNRNIYDGVSRIETTAVYTDNATTFAFYNAKTGVLDFVVGYDNLTAGVVYKCENVDYVINPYTGFAQFIYVPAHKVASLAGSEFEYKYVYITGDAMNYKLKDSFGLLGVVDVEGNTDALIFSVNYAGNEAATEAALVEIVELYQDMLCHVILENGKVKAIAPVVMDGVEAPMYLEGYAEYFSAAEIHFASTGAIVLLDGTGRALNVNYNTVLVNEGKVGYAINNMDVIYGENLYVVYAGSTALAIFVTPTSAVVGEVALADVLVKNLTADSFSDVTFSFTYDVAADADAKVAAIEKAVLNGTALSMIEGLGVAENEITVTVGTIAPLTDDGLVNLVTVTVATATATKTVEIVIFFEVVEDAE